MLKCIGKQLANLHKINIPDFLPKQLNYGKEQFSNVKKYSANSEFDIWLSSIIDYISPYLRLNLPKSIVHSDIFWDNVIIGEDNNIVTIIDFEESVNYFRLFDNNWNLWRSKSDKYAKNKVSSRWLSIRN